MIRSIHPFPARMAPELALEKLGELKSPGLILDPMAGSGTVLRQATDLGHRAVGFDMDPLAVLMTRVWTTAVEEKLVDDIADRVTKRIEAIDPVSAKLSWMDEDVETSAFVDFWFAEPQKGDLRRIAFVLDELGRELADPQEQLALVSHSRPHKVADQNDFDVRPMFARSIKAVKKRLRDAPPMGGADIGLGDARTLTALADGSIDAVLTSPPYLNAIDYMRGHRLSLIWLGHRLGDLRTIRSTSIGAERAPDQVDEADILNEMRLAMGELDALPNKFRSMISRYVQDIHRMIAEISRVLKVGAHATFVMGNSCLRDVFIRNSAAVSTAAQHAGLSLVSETERPLPMRSRYLPMTSASLGKRMRTETILTFARA